MRGGTRRTMNGNERKRRTETDARIDLGMTLITMMEANGHGISENATGHGIGAVVGVGIAETRTETGVERGAEKEAKTKAEVEAETGVETGVETGAEAGAEADPETGAEIKVAAGVEIAVETEVETEPGGEMTTATRREPQGVRNRVLTHLVLGHGHGQGQDPGLDLVQQHVLDSDLDPRVQQDINWIPIESAPDHQYTPGPDLAHLCALHQNVKHVQTIIVLRNAPKILEIRREGRALRACMKKVA